MELYLIFEGDPLKYFPSILFPNIDYCYKEG
jgi:hypothetical protein